MIDTTTPRRRDAVATRQALLDAARELFGTRGYDQTTLRDIGERAGVDAALIARYFGNKVALYLAAIAAEEPLIASGEDGPLLDQLVRNTLRRTDSVGLGPVGRAILQPEVDDEIRVAARDHMRRRVLDPLGDRLRERGLAQPELHAELVTAALMGIISTRASGALPALSAASADDLAPLISDLLGRMLEKRD